MPDYISPILSERSALMALSKPPGLLKKKRRIDKVELFYLPSYIIDVLVFTDNEEKRQSLCVDAVGGEFAFIEDVKTSRTPDGTIRTCPFMLPQKKVEQRALEVYRHHLLHRGLMLRYKFEIRGIESTRPIYYPFWIGYYKRKDQIDFEAVDAVGGERQGAALRSVFMKALLHEKAG